METHSKFIATLLHRPANPLPVSSPSCLNNETVKDFIDAIAEATGCSSSSVTSVSHRGLDSSTHPHVIEVVFALPISSKAVPASIRVHDRLSKFETDNSLEIVLQTQIGYEIRYKALRLAVFDMDSTLIQQEVIDLLAAHAGVEERVSEITARAMNGEIDFSASLRERVELLKGLSNTVFEDLKPSLTLTPGAETLLRVLKRRGCKTALLSGGFVPLARWVAGRLGIDYVHANELEADEAGVLTGKLNSDCIIVDSSTKAELLKDIAKGEYISELQAVIAVGDGANDVPMLRTAGLGFAVNAKPRVQIQAPARLNGKMALLDILYVLGFTADEIERLDKV